MSDERPAAPRGLPALVEPYRRALATPGAWQFSVSGTIARLPIAMVGLGLVILVEARTGSYGYAGGISAAYIFANAAGGIPLARLVDRVGQRRVIAPAVSISVVALAVTILLIEADASAPVPHLAAALSGLTEPNIGAAVRARWSHMVRDRRVLDTAFALEAVNDEIVFVMGPTLTTLLSAGIHPWLGLVAAAVAAAVGTAWLVSRRDTEPPPRRPEPGQGRMPWGTLGLIVLSAFMLGFVLGGVEVGTVAFADERGRQALAGVLLAVWSLGSLVAGMTTGALSLRRAAGTRYRAGLVAMALLLVPLPVASGMVVLGAILFLCGMAIAPTLIAGVSWVETLVPPGRLNEGVAAVTTGLVAGVAPGAAATGAAVDAYGPSTAYWVPMAVAVLGVVAGQATRLTPLGRRTTTTAGVGSAPDPTVVP